MKITSIKQQVRRQDRYSIFVDGKYAFSLSELELINSGLRINQEFTAGELDRLKQTAVLDKAYTRALDLLARRARSEWELRDYLKRKSYEPEVIDATIQRLAERGYVDDEAFARSWVQSRRQLKSVSRRRLTAELRQKRIADDVIEAVMEEDRQATDEREVLRDLIARKRLQTRYQDDQKLLAYLVRQGYDYETIKAAMADL